MHQIRSRKIVTTLIAILISVLVGFFVYTPDVDQKTMVIRVVDGDTIVVKEGGEKKTIRLLGVDTPESVDPRKEVECFGKEASEKTKELVSGKTVRLEADETQSDKDKYGRYVRYVYLEDGTNINLLLIQQGYAYEYTYDEPYKYQKEFRGAQVEAQEKQLGLWSPGKCN